jgi:DNA replication and repair protein RecF
VSAKKKQPAPSEPQPALRQALRPAARIRRLQLTNFRSYRSLDIHLGEGPIVFLGENGAGKTNILEAISLMAPGRGLRRATLEDIASSEGDGSWAVSAAVEGAEGEAQLGTGIDVPAEDEQPSRRSRIERENVSSAAMFAEHLRIVWLIPEMDGLFLGPAGERRRFLDRLVLAIDAGHGPRVSAFERALRSRNRLLEEGSSDARWLDATEHEVAELAVALAAARAECVERLRTEIEAAHDPQSLFPAAELSLDGWMEAAVRTSPAIEVEDRYRAILRDTRERDRAAGRTLDGPHRTDLVLVHREKNIPAARASTGERKALLVGIVVSHARLVAAMHGFAPVMLLDDVSAFLDQQRRDALFELLTRFGAQVFMTGVDAASFEALGDAERFTVSTGKAAPKPKNGS